MRSNLHGVSDDEWAFAAYREQRTICPVARGLQAGTVITCS